MIVDEPEDLWGTEVQYFAMHVGELFEGELIEHATRYRDPDLAPLAIAELKRRERLGTPVLEAP